MLLKNFQGCAVEGNDPSAPKLSTGSYFHIDFQSRIPILNSYEVQFSIFAVQIATCLTYLDLIVSLTNFRDHQRYSYQR